MIRCRGPIAAAGLWLALMLAVAARADEPPIPAPRGFVNDFAGVLDGATAAHLENLIGELRAKTGAEIAVVTVESTQPLTVFDYAMKVAEAWKPGGKSKDNGVVFLVAVRDRKLHIVTGYGVEGALPDGRVGEIRDQLIVPRFKAGDFAGGIRAGTEALAGVIAQDARMTLSGAGAPPRPHRARGGIGLIPLLVLLAFVVILFQTGLWPLLFIGNRRGGFFGDSFGGGGFGGSSGGFGGFGGGSFGGGGAGGDW